MNDQVELLFFDTFAHDNSEEINLDLVQFPQPVYVTEVRIIPLGARVQADFPGGVRLGATNPSQFQIEFFVNDLGKRGASTFETLGGFEYDQNGCINLECTPDETIRKIPTDGLVLKGWYTTITLAVYGTLTNNITEQIIQPVTNQSLPSQPNTIADAQQICSNPTIEPEWHTQENVPTTPLEYSAQQPVANYNYNSNEQFPQEFGEYYTDIPKDPRSYHHSSETEWDNKGRPRISDTERDRDRNRDIQYQKGGNVERELNRSDLDRRDKERRFSRSESRDRDRQSREYREADIREQEQWADAEQPDYHGESKETEWSERERVHDRERNERFKYDDNYRRGYNRGDDRERDDRKRPRTPPLQSPKRPHTPFGQEHKELPHPESENVQLEESENQPKDKEDTVLKSPVKEKQTEENLKIDVEEFEPILSDEDIPDDTDHYQDMDYDYSSYTINDDIIKLFTPGVTELKKYPRKKEFLIKDNLIEIENSLRNVIGIADEYLKSSITKYEISSFDKLNTEIKEEFIHLCEKLISTLGPSTIFCGVVQFYVATKSMNPENMTTADKELFDQVSFVVETIIEWQKIALDYDLANIQDQPAYKIRHIKCGVKLADWSCASSDFIMLLYQNNIIIHKELLNLYNKEFMALSIKLMILKALDTYLQNKFAIEKFLLGDHDSPRENGYGDVTPSTESNGYKCLVEHLQKNPLVRLKFALQSIVRKLNLYEVLQKMYCILIQFRNASHDISAEEINLITKSLNQIHTYCQTGTFSLSQPKRFLPVASQFEILRNNNYGILVEYFKMFNVLQCFVLLLTHPSTLNLPLIKTPIFEIVSFLLKCPEGLQYLSENIETVDVLLKCLLHSEEELQYQNFMEMKSHQLGLKIAYSLQSLYHIELLLDIGKKNNVDFDCIEIIEQLHGLFCLTFCYTGKISVAEILSMDNNMDCLIQFIGHLALKDKSESFLNKARKSSGFEYIIDLITFTVVSVSNVSLLEKHHKILLHLTSQQDIFEQSVSNRLGELKQYLLPFETTTSLSYDNTSPYLELIDKYSESFMYNIGSITVSLRILYYLGISSHDQALLSENPLCHFIELKYKHVILQLYSLDGMSILAKLLQKIYEYYEQPGLHSFVLVSNKGVQLLNMIHIAVLLIQKMLSYAIQCRNTLFKDLTTIPVLLQTYNLLNSFPNSASGYTLSQDIKAIIIETLLVYTQPVSEEVTEKDTLNKTLWTQMCGEVIKYVTFSPHTFISGLLIFSELLPLPLPIQTRDELSKEEISWIINLRKLWSAHLHPHSAMIQDMVNKLCISTQPQLLNLLRRICVQISDLAANSAIMIARGILDNIYDAVVQKEEIKSGACSSYAARLLNFLACLVTHNTIKCAVLHLIHTNSTVTLKTDEKYVSLIPAFVQIVKNCNSANNHIQAQECILSIIQSFCDCEIALLQTSPTGNKITSDEYLANAMPLKEHLLGFIQMMLDHLVTDNSFVTYLPIVRTFLLLTEHDYGFYNLKDCSLKKNDIFSTLLKKLSDQFSVENAECLSTLNTLVEFLRVSVTVEEDVEPILLYTPREIKLTLFEMKTLIGWPVGNEKPENHPLNILEGILKKAVEENKAFESFLESVSALLKVVEEESTEVIKKTYQEVLLPAPEPLLAQYAHRTIFSSADASDERLTTRYWLATPADEGEADLENVTCDLMELCRQTLPPDFNLVREAEKLCRISSSENTDEKETRMNEDNDKMKKPFVTPMRARGFARSVQQRPDLFRSRPPNTSRPPSLHVDDFVALETCGAQPTGPTGYNKISRELLASTRVARGTRGRAFVTSERSVQYRQMPWWGAGMGRGPYQI